MDTNPLISIIVPIFNGEEYLVGTIESVISQTYLNWEMILVDDCSTDKTSAIINRFVASDTRIRKITLESSSGGPSRPRNKGLSVAKGDFVAFLDAYDVWDVNKLSVQVDFILQSNADLVHCGSIFIDSKGQQIDSWNSSKKYKYIDLFLGSSTRFMIFNPIILSSVLLKNIPEVLFREDCHVRAIEDWALWIELSLKLKKIRMNTGNLVYYRVHENSISSLEGEKQYLKGIYLYSLLLVENKIGLIKFLFLTLYQVFRSFKFRIFGRHS